MDVSFEEQKVDTVVADLNRMKQGKPYLIVSKPALTIPSPGKPDHKRRQVYLEKERRKEHHRFDGRLNQATNFISSQRHLLQRGKGSLSPRFDHDIRMGCWRCNVPDGGCQGHWNRH